MSKACQLFSGSKGNSVYVACSTGKFLVDVGVSAKRTEKALDEIGVSPSELCGIFVTHEHTDHISGLRVFACRYNLDVYAHPDVIAAMRNTKKIDDKVKTREITSPLELAGVKIIPFENSHDSVACLGYRFDMSDGRSICVCTDTGYVTDDAREKMRGCDLAFLESNHEVTMLQNGTYTYQLKQRILSPTGHLSNFACAEYACELVRGGTTRIVLSHLSRENNMPDIAYQTTLCALRQEGFKENKDFRLSVSPQENHERPIVL